LRLAGVAEADVCDEYALSSRANAIIRERSRIRRAALGRPDRDESFYAAWSPTPAVMAAALAIVDDRWGGVGGWAYAHGLADAEISTWRQTLTEPGPITSG
jgi:hypothetical protein